MLTSAAPAEMWENVVHRSKFSSAGLRPARQSNFQGFRKGPNRGAIRSYGIFVPYLRELAHLWTYYWGFQGVSEGGRRACWSPPEMLIDMWPLRAPKCCNMLHIDRSPRCCVNMFNMIVKPYGGYRSCLGKGVSFIVYVRLPGRLLRRGSL